MLINLPDPSETSPGSFDIELSLADGTPFSDKMTFRLLKGAFPLVAHPSLTATTERELYARTYPASDYEDIILLAQPGSFRYQKAAPTNASLYYELLRKGTLVVAKVRRSSELIGTYVYVVAQRRALLGYEYSREYFSLRLERFAWQAEVTGASLDETKSTEGQKGQIDQLTGDFNWQYEVAKQQERSWKVEVDLGNTSSQDFASQWQDLKQGAKGYQPINAGESQTLEQAMGAKIAGRHGEVKAYSSANGLGGISNGKAGAMASPFVGTGNVQFSFGLPVKTEGEQPILVSNPSLFEYIRIIEDDDFRFEKGLYLTLRLPAGNAERDQAIREGILRLKVDDTLSGGRVLVAGIPIVEAVSYQVAKITFDNLGENQGQPLSIRLTLREVKAGQENEPAELTKDVLKATDAIEYGVSETNHYGVSPLTANSETMAMGDAQGGLIGGAEV
jgi:hypothetical protein